MPSTVLCGQIPNVVLSPNSPLFNLPPKIFGDVCLCPCFRFKGDKLDPKSIKHVFLRYSRTHKGYKRYSSTFQRHFVNTTVTFFEPTSYFSSSFSKIDNHILLAFLN